MTCIQPLIIHADGTGSCYRPRVLDRDTLSEAVGRHRTVVNCLAVLGPQCPVCTTSRTDEPTQPHDRPAGGTRNRCAVAPPSSTSISAWSVLSRGASPDPGPRRAWLGQHVRIRPCSALADPCPLCSVGVDTLLIAHGENALSGAAYRCWLSATPQVRPNWSHELRTFAGKEANAHTGRGRQNKVPLGHVTTRCSQSRHLPRVSFARSAMSESQRVTEPESSLSRFRLIRSLINAFDNAAIDQRASTGMRCR